MGPPGTMILNNKYYSLHNGTLEYQYVTTCYAMDCDDETSYFVSVVGCASLELPLWYLGVP